MAAVAGIAVGITLSIVSLVILLAVLWRRRRGKKAAVKKASTNTTPPVEVGNAIEMSEDFRPSEVPAEGMVPELDGVPLSELHGCHPFG